MSSSTVNFSGLASGIDSASLIDATIQQQRSVRIEPLEDKIASYEETKDSLTKLKELLEDLKTASQEFRTINGGALSKNVYSTDETVLSASATNSATPANYEITVTQTAKTGTFSFGERFSSQASTLASTMSGSDTIDITIGGETVSINVDSSTTLEGFVNSFNSQSNNGCASMVNVGSTANPSYVLMITSNESGLEKGEISISVGENILDANPSLSFENGSLSQAQNAKLNIAGVGNNIERSSNTFSDLIQGVTFKANSVGTVNIQTEVDTETTLDKVQDFINAYNEVVSYIKENDEVTSEQDGEDIEITYGALSQTSLDENILSTIRSAISGAKSEDGSVRILADMGITTASDGTLELDEDTFTEALGKDSRSASKILENLGEDLGAVNGKIFQFTGYNMLIDQANSNLDSQITASNNKIATLEEYLAKYEERLTKKYANLEALMSELNSQQATITSILGSL